MKARRLAANRLATRPQPKQHVETVHKRHFQIEQEELKLGVVAVLRGHGAEVIDRFLSVTSMNELVPKAGLLKSTTQKEEIVLVVLSNENMTCATDFPDAISESPVRDCNLRRLSMKMAVR